MRILASTSLVALLIATAPASAASPDSDMKKILDALASLDGKPIETLTPEQARQQPTAADAAMKVIRDGGKSTLPDDSVMTKNIAVDGGAGLIPATVYTPAKGQGPRPVVVYYHGGGFVIANNAAYDASARALAELADAVVVSVEYRRAPENKFPAAHDDAVAAYTWVTKNAASIGGDAARIGLAGESAGGNLAINTAIAARDKGLPMPLHVVLIYPAAGVDMNTPSYRENANAKPLSKPMMEWFFKNVGKDDADRQDPRFDLVGKADMGKLPPVTMILAEIDPLRSDGEMLADKLKQAGNKIDLHSYKGVTHEFFGMGAVVSDAKAAQKTAADGLKKDLARK